MTASSTSMLMVFSWVTQPRSILENPSAELQRTTWVNERLRGQDMEQYYSQTYIAKLLPSEYFFFSLSFGWCGSVGPVTHPKAAGHCIVVHDGLGAKLLTLSVADDTEIFTIPESVLCPVTHLALRAQHLKHCGNFQRFCRFFFSLKLVIFSKNAFISRICQGIKISQESRLFIMKW